MTIFVVGTPQFGFSNLRKNVYKFLEKIYLEKMYPIWKKLCINVERKIK